MLLRIVSPVCLALAGISPSDAQDSIRFAYDVRPILAQKCFGCHGPDEAHREAKLRLDTKDGIFADAQSLGKIVEPGAPDDSEIVYRLTTDDEDDRMPPKDVGERLSPTEIAAITQWIEDGAEWSDHWSFVAPSRPELPAVSDASWPKNGIDYLVLARLERERLAPSPEADRNTLIRRVSLDLTGLPPTWDEVKAFVEDTTPDAYEKMVDRMLASPHYGERWARVWLDLARYSDTKGYEKDLTRTIWRYRDWVIDAFNRDLPYDQFTIEQLAGDLLPNATMEQKLATAFHRNTMTNDEGGTDDEEFRVAAVRDRIDTTMQVWMGLTMGCAKCHDHKYDPISSKEYYQFFAFFNQTADGDFFTDAPLMPAPTPEQIAEIETLEGKIGAFERVLKVLDEIPANEALISKTSETGEAPAEEDIAAPVREAIEELRTEIKEIPAPRIPVMQELPEDKHRTTHVMIRGDFLDHGEAVNADVPAYFHEFPENAPRNRAGVAAWLMDEANPLTARVAVNRHWAQLFGRGLVETEEDFGSQGMLPTHPDLLDWLAVEFMESGWSFKTLCKTIVMSATYRQSSFANADLLDRDPANGLLARGPRFRLAAETVRDNALTIAGLLSEKMYGPSVMPPQPEGIWRSTYNDAVWVTSQGEDRYRRGIYTFHKRTSPYPSMLTFDSPTREWCTIRRIRSNTPLQALTTLNDPVYIEAAQAFARRIMTEGGETPSDKAAFAMRAAVSREATAREIDALTALFERRRAYYTEHYGEAHLMATDPLGGLPAGTSTPDAAAWTAVCNVILNLDEVMTKG